jgi:hypothetical protein
MRQLMLVVLLSGCGASRQAQYERGHARMNRMLKLQSGDDKAIEEAAYSDPTMAGAYVAVSQWLRRQMIRPRLRQ